MGKPKLQIIALFQNLGDKQTYFASSPAPPLSGALVAGLTPPIVEVELLHEMVRPIDYNTDADFIALSFMDFCAPHAYEVAAKFRKRGKIVVAGGRYPSTFPGEVIPHMDAVVVGEAERMWPQVVEDMVKGKLKKVYEAPFAPSLENIPPPRYDLVEPQFAVPIVTEATRGCKYRCSFCQLTVKPAPFRCRPVEDVIRDLRASENLPFYKRKMAMLLDNNFGADMGYAKELLREIAKLKFWGIGVQFSFDCLQDDEFVELLHEARCGMAFIGLESLNEPSLSAVHKKQNKVQEYQELFRKLKERGILTFTGLMVALEEDTPEYYRTLPEKLDEIDPSAILTSIAIPIPGTPFHKQVEEEGRIFDRDLSHYDGDHLVFKPKHVSPEEVFEAYRKINRHFYSWKNILKRWWRFIRTMSQRGNHLWRLFRSLVLSFAFFKLSTFQRGHARKRVYPIVFEKGAASFREN
ncbi:MAG: B12-binding domain-containing radical SAM protein [Desulfobacterota bacterium]|nr:B12-binding domain-containing radical SAM protein [Thermodesulfobacteriota bacterium]